MITGLEQEKLLGKKIHYLMIKGSIYRGDVVIFLMCI